MDNKEKAIQLIEEGKVSDNDILCAFDIVGRKYLEGEYSFINDAEGMQDIISDFELTCEELFKFLFKNPEYHCNDEYICFNGRSLITYRDISYFKKNVIKKMDGECAEYILGCV